MSPSSVRAAAALTLACLLAACAEYRNFSCSGCARLLAYNEPGEVPCRECLKVNIIGRCPACNTVEPAPELGKMVCTRCGKLYFSSKCGRCLSLYFSTEARAACPSCAAEAAAAAAPPDGPKSYLLACEAARRGELDTAFTHLARSVELKYADASLLEKDPDLAPLRRDPRFDALLLKARSR